MPSVRSDKGAVYMLASQCIFGTIATGHSLRTTHRQLLSLSMGVCDPPYRLHVKKPSVIDYLRVNEAVEMVIVLNRRVATLIALGQRAISSSLFAIDLRQVTTKLNFRK